MRVKPIFALALPLLVGCANQELVRADDMSAAQHRAEAKREDEAAVQAASRSPAAGAQPHSAADPAGDPKAEYLREAERRREHARQHGSAAEFLEHFEDRACRHVPASSRGACPLLGPLTRIDDVPGGIRATFADRERAATALTEMRCHHAYARARHFDEAVACALYVKGVELRPALDPNAIEIVSRDEKTVRQIRERGRQQAVFGGGRATR